MVMKNGREKELSISPCFEHGYSLAIKKAKNMQIELHFCGKANLKNNFRADILNDEQSKLGNPA